MKKIKNANNIPKKLRTIMLVFFVLLIILVFRLGFLQFVQSAELKEKMYNQLITSRIVSPHRGTIYDSTGKALAVSARGRYN